MTPETFLQFLHRIEPLKSVTRHCETAAGTPESVAAHSWRIATMAMLLRGEFPELDMDRVIHMCLIHDFGEAVTGDIPSFLKTGAQEETECDAVGGLVNALEAPANAEVAALFSEMDALITPEARFYKALDKLEAVIQHNESDIASWIPLEYDLNLTYGTEQAAEFPFLAELRARMLLETKEKIRQAGGSIPNNTHEIES